MNINNNKYSEKIVVVFSSNEEIIGFNYVRI